MEESAAVFGAASLHDLPPDIERMLSNRRPHPEQILEFYPRRILRHVNHDREPQTICRRRHRLPEIAGAGGDDRSQVLAALDARLQDIRRAADLVGADGLQALGLESGVALPHSDEGRPQGRISDAAPSRFNLLIRQRGIEIRSHQLALTC